MQKRKLLKLGLIGGVILAGGSLIGTFAGRNPQRDRDMVLQAVATAVLDTALPEQGESRDQAIRQAVAASNIAIAGLAPAAQAELIQLFTLLAATPTRLALAGLSKPWPEVSVQEVAEFLNRWRTHPLALMQSGYHALHDLVAGPWYGNPATWAAIGYPGPVAL